MSALATVAVTGGAFAQATGAAYGVLDLNLQNSAAGTTIGSGGYSTSRFGFKGAVDLGGGLKATGMVETKVDASNPSATTLGNRGANVGIEGAWGKVSLGNQFTGYAMSFFNDATEYDGFSPIWWGDFNTGTLHGDRVWQKHSIQYTSPTWNGMNFNVTAAPGADGKAASVTGSFDATTGFPKVTNNPAQGASNYTSVGVNYTPISVLALSFGWESDNPGLGVTTSAWNLGAALQTMGAVLYADINRAENGTLSDNGWMVSVATPISGTYSFQGGYSLNTISDANSTKISGLTGVVLNDISKQTRFYAGFARNTTTGSADATTYLAGVKLSF